MLKTAPASMNLETALECAYRLAASSGIPHYTRQAFRPGRGWRWTFSMERPAGSEVFVVDVLGVGYEVLIPLSSFDRLPKAGSDVHLLTHLSIREDAHVLYGFMTSAERELFRLLIHTVSGIDGREPVESQPASPR